LESVTLLDHVQGVVAACGTLGAFASVNADSDAPLVSPRALYPVVVPSSSASFSEDQGDIYVSVKLLGEHEIKCGLCADNSGQPPSPVLGQKSPSPANARSRESGARSAANAGRFAAAVGYAWREGDPEPDPDDGYSGTYAPSGRWSARYRPPPTEIRSQPDSRPPQILASTFSTTPEVVPSSECDSGLSL
jgi:hypothetical protein